jgi:hypothetical protein
MAFLDGVDIWILRHFIKFYLNICQLLDPLTYPKLCKIMISWAGKALETVNCYAFLKRRLTGAC